MSSCQKGDQGQQSCDCLKGGCKSGAGLGYGESGSACLATISSSDTNSISEGDGLAASGIVVIVVTTAIVTTVTI